MMRSLSATSQKAARVTRKLSSLSINTSRFGKSLPRTSRARALQNAVGKKTIKRRHSLVSPSVSPNHELETTSSATQQEAVQSPASPSQEVGVSVAGHVAMGPWSGPYEVSPLVVAESEDDSEDELKLSPTLLDDAGGSQFELKYLADEAFVVNGIATTTASAAGTAAASSDCAADKQPVASSSSPKSTAMPAAAAKTSPKVGAGQAGQEPRPTSPTNFGLSEEDAEELRKKMEEAAQVKAAVWASHPVPRKLSRLPRYDRGAAHGRCSHPRALYNMQQPRTRNANKSQ